MKWIRLITLILTFTFALKTPCFSNESYRLKAVAEINHGYENVIGKDDGQREYSLSRSEQLNVYFHHNSSVLMDAEIVKIRSLLRNEGKIILKGFSSRPGTESRNKELRTQRVLAVKNLIHQLKPKRKVELIESDPPTWEYQVQRLNRRVQITMFGEQ